MTHAQARAILTSAFQQVQGRAPVGLELNYIQAVAWLETNYGTAGQFAGTHNWGAIHAGNAPPCGAGQFEGQDQGAVCFVSYPDDVTGAAGFVRVLTVNGGRNQTVLPVLANGSPDDVAAAMHASGYFTAPAATYAQAIRNALTTIGAPAPIPSSVPTSRNVGILGAILGALAIGGATYWVLENKRFWPRYLRA